MNKLIVAGPAPRRFSSSLGEEQSHFSVPFFDQVTAKYQQHSAKQHVGNVGSQQKCQITLWDSEQSLGVDVTWDIIGHSYSAIEAYPACVESGLSGYCCPMEGRERGAMGRHAVINMGWV